MSDIKIDVKRAEKLTKGFANRWRIKILFLLDRDPGLTVDGVCKSLDANFLTTASHLSKLAQVGFIEKKYRGRYVEHQLTKLGRHIITLCKML